MHDEKGCSRMEKGNNALEVTPTHREEEVICRFLTAFVAETFVGDPIFWHAEAAPASVKPGPQTGCHELL